MPDRREGLVRWAAQFRHQHGRTERAVGHLLTHINVGAAEAAWTAAPKVELRRTLLVVLALVALTILLVLEIAGALIVGGRVDSWTEVHRRLPVEIIVRVAAP